MTALNNSGQTFKMYLEGAHFTWQTRGCPTENMLLLDLLVHFRQLL